VHGNRGLAEFSPARSISTFAFISIAARERPARILRGNRSGVLGPRLHPGTWTITLGQALHFFIAVCAAFVF